MVRQAAMALKCILLIYYKNSRGRDYRKQVIKIMNFQKFFSVDASSFLYFSELLDHRCFVFPGSDADSC